MSAWLRVAGCGVRTYAVQHRAVARSSETELGHEWPDAY